MHNAYNAIHQIRVKTSYRIISSCACASEFFENGKFPDWKISSTTGNSSDQKQRLIKTFYKSLLSLRRMPLWTKKFDSVYSSEVLQHILMAMGNRGCWLEVEASVTERHRYFRAEKEQDNYRRPWQLFLLFSHIKLMMPAWYGWLKNLVKAHSQLCWTH